MIGAAGGGMSARTVVGARFMTAGRMYFFEPGEVADLALNEWVVVQTDLGLDAARVQLLPTDSPLVQVDPPLGRVLRRASAADRFEMAKQKRREPEAVEEAVRLARQRGLPVRILGADWQLDGANLTLFYSSEERADVAALAADLAAHFDTRVEMRKMGARDETKVMTGVGTCGRELCCSSWLDKFSNISIRMAKEQDLPLNQSKLTGVCGRLKCCLIYELETYQEVKGKLPKLGETFHIPSCVSGACGTGGCAQTQGVSMTKEAIVVGMTDGTRQTLTAAELGVTFDPVPAHTKGVGSYGGDEIPRQERPTPLPAGPDGGRRRRRRRGGRRGGAQRPPADGSPPETDGTDAG
jgi:cell fate regulator YaaT (PSP1 superfamily)